MLTDAGHDCTIWCTFQLSLIAYDSAYPEVQTSAQVIISVLRNVNGPIFLPVATYHKTLVDSFEVGSVVEQVTATDSDEQVRRLHSNLSIPTTTPTSMKKWSLTTGFCLIQGAFNTGSTLKSDLC